MGLFSIFKKSNLLYYPGCSTYFKNRETFELYKKILAKLGINIIVLDSQICCGLAALENGYETEARRLAKENQELFRKNDILKIITNCPACYKMFLKDYKELLPEWNIEVQDIWELILQKLEEKPGLIKNREEETISFQDSCYLGRHCEVYETPRKILELIGYNIKEMRDNKENSFCSGSCGQLPLINPKLSDEIAKDRLGQAKRIGIKKIVVTSTSEYEILSKNTGDTGIEIIELSEIMAKALDIKEKKQEKEEENNELIIEKSKEIKEEENEQEGINEL
jgi:Fe-S oxidoreductase